MTAVIIAFDAKRYFNNATGLGFYSRTLLEGLRRFYPEHQYLLYTPYNRGRIGAVDDGIRLPDSWLGRTFHPVWRSRGMTRQLKKDGVQVFHGLSHELPLGLRNAGIRSVVSVHDLIFMRHPELYPGIDRYFYEKKYRRAALEADVVVAISEQTRTDLDYFFGIPAHKVQVIGQACDAMFERLSFRHLPDPNALPVPDGISLPEDPFLLCVGSLIPRKNWHQLIRALELLKLRGYDIPLVAVGSGKSTYALGLEEQAIRAGIRVHWVLRHLPTEALAGLYRRAAGMVYPSVFEGFGIPILEAMTVGIPVLTTRGGCFEEVGGPAALYASPDQPEEIADQILQLLNPQIRAKLLPAMTTQIAQFAPEKICAAWMETYLGT
ncbi:MAG: glycosyltransferase family 4 protein [Saprospiraceae bacterium]|nr:glycosyltransferase family 4 protein [Saprospiraceae bacterium]